MRDIVFTYARFLRPYRSDVIKIGSLMAAFMLLAFLEPLFLMLFVNEIVLKTNLYLLVCLAAVMISTAAAMVYLFGVTRFHRAELSQRVLRDIRGALYAHFLGRQSAYFDAHAPSELAVLGTAEVDAIDGVSDILFWGIGTVFGVTVILGTCFLLDWRVAMPLVALLPILALLARFDSLRRPQLQQRALDAQAAVYGYWRAMLQSVPFVQVFRREAAEACAERGASDTLAEARVRVEGLTELSGRLFDLARGAVLAAILLIGGVLIIERSAVTLGVVTAIFAYAEQLSRELHDLFTYVLRARSAGVALRRVVAVLDDDELAVASGCLRIGRARGELQLEDVWFRYRHAERWVNEGVDLRVRQGELVALVGESGAGKTSLFKLLLRLYDPQRGRVLLDGVDVRSLALDDLRGQFAVATQESSLVAGTVADNIRYGRPTATMNDVVAAAKAAAAYEFIQALPRGFDTRIGPGGLELSGGQRHRVAFARAMLMTAPVLLLDELSEGLDAKSEGEIQTTLSALREGRTTLIIAHRLSTILRADKIVVIEGGRVRQQGSHKELVADAAGLYRSLFDRQFKDAFESLGTERRTQKAPARPRLFDTIDDRIAATAARRFS